MVEVMESGTIGVVVQSVTDGYDADIIQILDGKQENPREHVVFVTCCDIV